MLTNERGVVPVGGRDVVSVSVVSCPLVGVSRVYRWVHVHVISCLLTYVSVDGGTYHVHRQMTCVVPVIV